MRQSLSIFFRAHKLQGFRGLLENDPKSTWELDVEGVNIFSGYVLILHDFRLIVMDMLPVLPSSMYPGTLACSLAHVTKGSPLIWGFAMLFSMSFKRSETSSYTTRH